MKKYQIIALTLCLMLLPGCLQTNHSVPVISAYEKISRINLKKIRPVSVAVRQSFTSEVSCARVSAELNEIYARYRPDSMDVQKILSMNQKLGRDPAYLSAIKRYQGCSPQGTMAEQRSRISEVSAQYLKSYLSQMPAVTLVDTRYAKSEPEYIISISITQIVPDISKEEDSKESPFGQLGYIAQAATPYVGIASASTLGPLGGLLMGFDVITGIPVGLEDQSKDGEITADIQIINTASGIIKASFAQQARYGSKYSSVGDPFLIQSGIGSGSAKFELITLENAAQSIAYESARKFLSEMN